MAQATTSKSKKKVQPLIQCMNCEHADLHQWMNNPVISICSKKNGERFVATCEMACALYHEPGLKLAPVVHRHASYKEGPTL